MSIRVRLVIMCLAVALLPAIPLSFLVQSLLDKSFNVGLNETVEEALQSGLAISRERLEQTRSSFESQVGETVSALSGLSNDSEEIAAAIIAGGSAPGPGRVGEARPGRIDGFILGQVPVPANPEGESDPAGMNLTAFAADSVYARLVNHQDIIRRPQSTGRSGLTFYETSDRSVLLAAWNPAPTDKPSIREPGPESRPVLFYKKIDPDFLDQANQLLTGRQIFAQLRLTQGELNRSFLYPFIIIYAVILLLALTLAFLIAERLANPIRRLVRGTRIIAAGDWSYREKTRAGGETGQLIKAFNSMITRLEQQQRRLIDMEKMTAWREMARRLAHEIKNPLLPIRLTMQEIKDQYRGDDPIFGQLLADSTRVIGDELDSLQKLVKEFSSFARMPAINPRPGSLPRLLEDVARLYIQPPVSVTAEPAIPDIPFDPDQLRRVLINLFDNSAIALQDRPDGRIQIDLASAGGEVEIRFADNGPGIPPAILPNIFDPYFTTRSEGTGLGLAMVKNIILLHGGSIDVDSAAGQGTVFYIRLPVNPAGRETSNDSQKM
jgi:nitrogen fixation/metabolism regulation signal transduction histidine kinase